MANLEHLEILKRGVEVWNEWRRENSAIIPDLIQADLNGVDLRKANLHEARVQGAQLVEARMGEANLNNAFLCNASLIRADLSGARLSEANLEGANLAYANLERSILWSAVLRGANLDNAKLVSAVLDGADLSTAFLLEADLSGAQLCASFGRAFLYKAKLVGANLRGAGLEEANLSWADLTGADLRSANLRGANLVGAQLGGCDLTGASVYGASVWDVVTDNETRQTGLAVSPPQEPQVFVDDIEVAQFIYLLLNRKKLRNVINAVTETGVLILGRFGGGGLEVLQAVANWLRQPERGYLPLIFDFDRLRDQNYTETVKTLVGLSRFVIVDLSGPSVPQELSATVPFHKIPFIPILEKGRKDWSMAPDILEYPWVLNPSVVFSNVDELLDNMSTKIEVAEQRIEKRRERLREMYDA